jgi:hypothetical protein
MPIEYQPFDTFRATVQQLVAPEDLAEQLVPFFRDQVGNALADIQTLIEGFRSFNLQFITKDDVSEFCATSIFQGPVGKVTQIFAYKPGKDCRKLYYQRTSVAAMDCWMERQRCVLCNATTPPSHQVYDNPYCNYWLEGDEACGPPYLLTEPEDDCKFRGLDDDDRIFAVGPDYKIYAAPRFPCGYNLLVQWQGVNRKWNGVDMVPVDQQLREAVTNYVEHKIARKEKDHATSDKYFSDYTINLRTIRYRYEDEKNTEAKRDCSAGIEQLMAAATPLYPSPIYGPAHLPPPAPVVCPECPECPECPDIDTALDQAIYVASEDAIFSCRGQWVFRFNATTGAIEDEFRWIGDATARSSIVSLNGKLYLTAWETILEDTNVAPFDFQHRDLYEVDFAMSTSTPLGLASHISGANEKSVAGFSNLVTDGTFIFGFEHGIGSVFKVDPTNIAGFVDATGAGSGTAEVVTDFAYDAINSLIWQASNFSREVQAFRRSNLGTFDTADTFSLSPPQAPVGVTYSPITSAGYAVTVTGKLIKVPVANFATRSIIAGVSTLGAVRLKFNANDNLIYIPTWSNDTVIVYDPSSDTVSNTKTGFNSPFDVVFTPTKKWAVQNSPKALKEIV